MNSAMQQCYLSGLSLLADHPRQTVRLLLPPLRRRASSPDGHRRSGGLQADSGNPVSVTGAASSPAPASAASPSTAGVLAASVPTDTVFSIRAWQRDRSGPTEVARISSAERRLPSRSSYSLV